MNRGIDSVATGMAASERWLDVVANNLANASTNGFKRDTLLFSNTLEQQLRSDGGQGQSIGSIASGGAVQNQFTDFSQGPISPTGNPLDLAIRGESGAFAVQTPDGVKYTRDGSFMLNAGRLTTRDGNPVLDDRQQPIDLPPGDITIENGVVSVAGKSVATIGVFDGRFSKIGANLMTSDSVQPMDSPSIVSNALEGSNVSPIQSMIEMIQIGRSYEIGQKSITSQDDLSNQLIQSLEK